MNYLEFVKDLREFPVFSIKDIQKRFPAFDNRRLFEWQQKGYIQKVRRGYYCFKESGKDERFLFFAANKMYSPSYVSLESILAYYNMIPEGVFLTTSVTTRNTAGYDTPIGRFEYRHIKPALFFGYKLIQEREVTFKIAEPEKLILDYFYLNKFDFVEQIEGMRFNEIIIKETLDFEKLARYQEVFDSKALNQRVKLFKKVINA